MRLQREGAPDTADRTLRQAGPFGHRAGAPVRRIRRSGLKREGQNAFDLGVGDGPGRSRTWFVQEAIYALSNEAGALLAHIGLVHPQLLGDRAVRLARRTAEDDPRASRERLSRRRSSCPPLQDRALVVLTTSSALGRPVGTVGIPPEGSAPSIIKGRPFTGHIYDSGH
jgi:hypothetical protein